MEKDTKNLIKKGLLTITSISALVIAVTHIDDAYYKFQPNVKVEIYDNKNEEENQTVVLEDNDIYTWASYNDELGCYNVDLDKMFSDFLLVNCLRPITKTEDNEISKTINEIKSYLGENIYGKDITNNSLTLTNLNNKEINVDTNKNYDYYTVSYPKDNNYQVYIMGSYDSYNYTYKKEYDNYLAFDKYCEYGYDKVIVDSLIYRRNDDLYLNFSVYDRYFEISSLDGKASFKIDEQEKNELIKEINSYNHSNDIRSFLVENESLINPYLEQIKEENLDLYMEIKNTINQIKLEQLSSNIENQNKVKTI